MGLGGPVWHASASAGTEATAWAMAERALRGVGDPALGEWRQAGRLAVHLRRRLSAPERAELGGLEVRDVRGTYEERRRLDAVLRKVPHLKAMTEALS